MELVTPEIGLVFWMIVTVFVIVLPIICLISILKNDFKNNDKLIWLVIVILTPILGSILYLLIGRKQQLELKNKNTKEQQ